MVQRRVWFAVLGVLGAGSLVYIVVLRGFVDPLPDPGAGLGWPVVGVLPLFAFGMWLLTATSSRIALYVALGATGAMVGAAYETLVRANPELLSAPAFPYLNSIGLTADAVATVGMVLMIASFPDGVLERRWQRVVLSSLWALVAVAPLTLLTTPSVVLPQYLGVEADVPNPVAVPWLEWAAPVVDAFLVHAWVGAALGLLVLLSRAFGGDERTRTRMRVMTWTVLVWVGSWLTFEWTVARGIQDTPLGAIASLATLSMLAVPAAGIHGILRYGAFDVADADRARLVMRSSSTLISVLYGIAVAAPALLLFDRLEPVSAVLLTAISAVVLLPVRAWLQRAIQRAVLGDRDHHLALLSELGARLEQAIELDEVLVRLADGVQRGLDASWVRVSVLGSDGDLAAAPAVVGEVAGEAVATHDLIRGDDHLGRIEVGPRRHGDYDAATLALLRTVAGQATTTVANVRLTAQLGEQLGELSASRARLITAQDAERRRIERDLHDGIQQSVVALIASLGLARQRLDRGALRPQELIELQDQAREMLTDLRELAHGIHPQVLTDRGLVAAVESRAVRFPIPVTVVADDDSRSRQFPPDVEAVAFYTVREALANVAKHASARSIRIGVRVTGDRLLIEVVDDGTGFRGRSDVGARHGGLTNIRDRVAAVQGRLTIDEPPGGGVRLTVDLPVQTDTADAARVVGVAPLADAPRHSPADAVGAATHA